MKTIKRVLLILLAILGVCYSGGPAFAADQQIPTIQPRYSKVNDWDITLDIVGSNTASVFAWVHFAQGTKCTLTVTLKKNGKAVEVWGTSSVDGYVSVDELVENLGPGTYEATMTFKCGTDSGSDRSGSKKLP